MTFRALLDRLARFPANNFRLIETQGVLNPAIDWTNELHPTPQGFTKIAGMLVQSLRLEFAGRI